MALSAPRAFAAGPSDAQVQAARELFLAAEKDEDAKRWSDALEKLRRVAQVRLTAGVRYHLALCEENVGELLSALADYTLAESQAKRENARDVVELVGPRLAKLSGRVPRLTLHVEGDQPDLEVRLDGVVVLKAMWGVAIPVDPGPHKIEASAGGYLPYARTVPMTERDNTLVEVAVTVRRAAPPPPTAPTPTPTPTEPANAPAPQPPAPTESRSHAGAIVATVGAVLLVGGGVASYFIAGGKHDSAVTTCATLVTPCDDLKHGVQTWDALALTGWIAGAALATVAIVAWASPSHETAHESAQAASSATLSVGPGSLWLRGSF